MNKTSKTILKIMKTYMISLSLIFSSSPSFAQSGANAIMGTLGVLQSTIQQGMQQQNQMQMDPKAIEARQALTRMQAEQANVNASLQTGSSTHYIFNNCLVPPDSTWKIENYCSVSTVDPQSMAQTVTVAQNYIKMYENFMKPRNSAKGIGKQCIMDTLQRMQDDAKGLLKKYDQGIEQFKANIKKAEDLQKNNIEKMQEISELLYRGTNKNPELADVNFTNLIGKDCSDAFKVTGQTLNQVGKSSGLLSISTAIDYTDDMASDFRGPSLQIKRKALERDIKILAKEYTEGGINNLTTAKAKNKIKSNNWALLENAMKSKLLDVKADTAEVNNILTQLNQTLGEQTGNTNSIPSLEDPNYQIKMNNMLGKLETQYENKYVLSCIRGQNSALRSTPIQKLLGDFRHRNVGTKGTVMNPYEDGTIASEIEGASSVQELKSLLSKYYNKNIYASVTNEKGKNVLKTLETLVDEQVSQCTNVFKGTDRTATGDDSLNNFRELLEKAKTKAKSIAKRTMGNKDERINIQEELANQLLNCDGRAITTQDCNDAKSLWSESSNNFCLKKANFCSTKIAQCGQRVKDIKNQYTTQLKNRETQYNNQVKILENQAQGMINKMKAELTTLAGNLHDKIFPKAISSAQRASIENSPYLSPDQKQYYLSGSGNDFNLHALEPISLNEDKNSIQGVALKGGENLRRGLLQMTEGHMNKMKKDFSQYVSAKLKTAETIAEDIQMNWENEMEAWANIKKQCIESISQIEQQEAERAQAQQEQVAQAQEGYTNFCNQLNGLAQQEKPNPGCGDDLGDLLQESMSVASVYVPDAYGLGQEMKAICMGANNNSSGEADDEKVDYVNHACRSGGGSWKKAVSKIKDRIKKDIPERLSKYENRIKNYIDGKSDNLPSKIQDDIFIYRIQDLKEIENGENFNRSFTLENISELLKEKYNSNSEIKALERTVASLKDKNNPDLQSKIDELEAEIDSKKGDKSIEDLAKSLKDNIPDNVSLCDNNNFSKVMHIESCIAKSSQDELNSCINSKKKQREARKDLLDDYDYRYANSVFENLYSLEKISAWSQMGEKYQYTSCAHITGNSIQKGILENMGSDMANPFIPTGFMR